VRQDVNRSRVLVVCTANVCRSAMAEALLRRALSTSGSHIEVSSAGTVRTATPLDPIAVRVLRDDFELDISHHQPRPLTKDVLAVDGADLVLTMTRSHLRRVVELDRSAFARTFTMNEFGRRLPAGAEHLDTWIATAHEGRTAADLMQPNPTDDIEDPYGKGEPAVRRSAHLINDLAVGLALGPWARVDRR
jgi:protein-tyrosine phosphatase